MPTDDRDFTDKNEELKDCPFCGGRADISTIFRNPNLYFSYCRKCRNKTDDCDSEEKCIILWNRRKLPEQVKEDKCIHDFTNIIVRSGYCKKCNCQSANYCLKCDASLPKCFCKE